MSNLPREVSKALLAKGFRRKDTMHQLRIGDDFFLCVDTGPFGKGSDIAPFVGIRHEHVEKLFAELLGVPASEWVVSIGANIGYVLHGRYQRWGPGTDANEVLQSIDSALDRYRPFFSLEKLLDAWEVAGISDPGRPYREIVILLMQKNFESVQEKLKRAALIFCKYQDEVCEQFRGFEARILNRIGFDAQEKTP